MDFRWNRNRQMTGTNFEKARLDGETGTHEEQV